MGVEQKINNESKYDIFLNYLNTIGIVLIVIISGLSIAMLSYTHEQRTTYEFVFLVFLITTAPIVRISNKRKDFSKLYSKILNKHSYVKMSATMGKLHVYLKSSDEETLLQNLCFVGKNVVFWYNSVFTTLIVVSIIVLVKSDSLDFLERSPIGIFFPDLQMLKAVVLFFFPTIFMYLLAFLYLSYYNFNYIKSNFKKLIRKSISNIATNFFVILFSLGASISILSLISQIKGINTNINVINITSAVMQSVFQNVIYFNITRIPSDGISIRLFLSCLYFTLALTGTVAFSISSVYMKFRKDVTNNLSDWVEKYEKWFEDNKTVVNFNIGKYHKQNDVDAFYNVINSLRDGLNFKKIDELLTFTTNYEIVMAVIALSFIAGICSLLIPIQGLNLAFVIFLCMSAVFIVSLFLIFYKAKN